MLKVLTSQQIRAVDEHTIVDEPIRSLDLMERAAESCSNWIKSNFSNSARVCVYAGMGNNGGDALAIARHLISDGFDVKVFSVKYAKQASPDCEANHQALLQLGVHIEDIKSDIDVIPDCDLIIDGLFGTGLSRPISGFSSSVVHAMNKCSAQIVSIDIPSGLYTDVLTPIEAPFILADYTLTFQSPKLAGLLPEAGVAFGESFILDIGLSRKAIVQQDSELWYVDDVALYRAHFQRNKFDHKGVFGHAIVAVGSKGKMGAAVICTSAVLRSGAGLCTAIVPDAGLSIIQTTVPEAMAFTHSEDGLWEKIQGLNPKVVGVGPGIGTDHDALILFEWILQHSDVPMVIDADGLNLLASNHKLLAMVPKGSILTPHVKEFDRLFGQHDNSFDRLATLKDRAKDLNVYIILKGAHTTIAAPSGELFFNSTGSPSLATAGSGDCLTGIICGLMSQTEDPLMSSICGVYIHGICGEMAAESVGKISTVAGDIISFLPDAITHSFAEI